ncbi:3'-5' exoribonuclease [Xanthomonas euvesicatoria]|uniref:3'-5' exoribonuclease n=1 Tax=Xanthomonas euvesicatoria TaxID=456327 RepID=UPI001C449CC4|nr:3'-5' exoribonuclease [Xanthomonas euvesicatoria]MBV6799642.1 3'-5' exoribonuclease [Xanthomonas campestris pv. obscurae]
MTTLVFLDTEWGDSMDSELISLGMITEDGVHRFYAEHDPIPAQLTEFARYRVLPHLQGKPYSMGQQAMTTGVRAFLSGMPDPCVVADYPGDFEFLRFVLAGFEMPDHQVESCGPMPAGLTMRLIKNGLVGFLIDDWFEAHPKLHERQHHALVDAQALRMAWLAATGQLGLPGWARTLRGPRRTT